MSFSPSAPDQGDEFIIMCDIIVVNYGIVTAHNSLRG